jgi:hypothetical protein
VLHSAPETAAHLKISARQLDMHSTVSESLTKSNSYIQRQKNHQKVYFSWGALAILAVVEQTLFGSTTPVMNTLFLKA